MNLRGATKMSDVPGYVRQVSESTQILMKNRSFLFGLAVGLVLATTIAIASYSLLETSNSRQESSYDIAVQPVVTASTVNHDDDAISNSKQDESVELHQLAKFKKRSNRSLALYSMLEPMDSSSLRNLWQESNELTTRSLKDDVEIAIVQKLATLEPRDVLTEIASYPTVRYHEFLEVVYEEWSRSDLETAVTFAQKLDVAAREVVLRCIMNSREDLSAEVLLNTARQLTLAHKAKRQITKLQIEQPITDPLDSWNTFVGDHQHSFWRMDSDQRTLLDNITEALVDELGPDAFDLVDHALTDVRDKTVALSFVAEQIAKNDPKLAFELMLTHPSRRNEIWVIALTWANTDPEAVLDAAVKIKRGRTQNQLIAAIVDQWTSDDPETLLQRLDSLPEKSRIYAERRAWNAFASKSPAQASKHLGQVRDATTKERVAESIATNWAKSDVEATLAWIKSNQELNHIQDRLTSTALRQFADLHPNKAFELALAQPLFDSGIGPEADVVGILARHNVDASIKLLNESRNVETRLAGMISVGSTLVVNRGNPDRAMELAKSALSEETRDEYFRTLIRYWTLMKPETIYPRIEQFPTAELRSTVASYLIQRDKENYSTDELEFLHTHLSKEAREDLGVDL